MSKFDTLFQTGASLLLDIHNGDTVVYRPTNGPCSSVVGIFILLDYHEPEFEGSINKVYRARFSIEPDKLKPPFHRTAKFEYASEKHPLLRGKLWHFDEQGLFQSTGSRLVIPLMTDEPLVHGPDGYRRELL
jgi:hypothetical protein